jgi:hypothetical protein
MGRGSANRAGDATRGLDRIENWCDLPRHVVHDHQFRLCRCREDATSRTPRRHNQRHLHSGAFLPPQFGCHGSCKRCRCGLRISISTDLGRYARQCLLYRRLLRGNASLALDVVGWTVGEFVLRIMDLSENTGPVAASAGSLPALVEAGSRSRELQRANAPMSSTLLFMGRPAARNSDHSRCFYCQQANEPCLSWHIFAQEAGGLWLLRSGNGHSAGAVFAPQRSCSGIGQEIFCAIIKPVGTGGETGKPLSPIPAGSRFDQPVCDGGAGGQGRHHIGGQGESPPLSPHGPQARLSEAARATAAQRTGGP